METIAGLADCITVTYISIGVSKNMPSRVPLIVIIFQRIIV